jgi:FkbM family methyltransferase
MRPYYYLGGNRGLTQLSTGQMFIVNTEARDIATWIIHIGVWEAFVDNILCALARPGDTFLDIGSNMGYYAVKIGGLVGENGRVFAYEPNPDLFEVLSDNMHINGFGGRATVFQAAAGEAAGASTLTFERRFPGGGTAGLGPEYAVGGREQAQIAVVSVDDTVSEGVAHLIKIDVEGFEPLVLRGMKDLMARSPDAAVVVEVSYIQWARFGDPVQMLEDFSKGRRIYRISNHGGLQELPRDNIDGALDRQFPSYLLLLPDTASRLAQIQQFLPGTAPDAQGESRPKVTLKSRLKARLLRSLKSY